PVDVSAGRRDLRGIDGRDVHGSFSHARRGRWLAPSASPLGPSPPALSFQEPARGPMRQVDRNDVPGYWITACGVATRRVTLICSRLIMVGTRGAISFFQ